MLDNPARETTIAEVDLMKQWVQEGLWMMDKERFARWIEHNRQFILNVYLVSRGAKYYGGSS